MSSEKASKSISDMAKELDRLKPLAQRETGALYRTMDSAQQKSLEIIIDYVMCLEEGAKYIADIFSDHLNKLEEIRKKTEAANIEPDGNDTTW